MEHNADLDTPWWIWSQAERSAPLAFTYFTFLLRAHWSPPRVRQRSEERSTVAENLTNNAHSQQFSRNWTSLKLCSKQTMTAWRRWVRQEQEKHQSHGKYGACFEGAKSTAHQPNHINTNAHIVYKNEGSFEHSQEILLLMDDFSLAERFSTLIFLDASSCSLFIWRRLFSPETGARHLSTFMKMWRRHFWWIQIMFKQMPSSSVIIKNTRRKSN